MATATVVAMTTSRPIWTRYPEFFRGVDDLLVWLARKPGVESRCVEQAARAMARAAPDDPYLTDEQAAAGGTAG
jgi:hypothetical protein